MNNQLFFPVFQAKTWVRTLISLYRHLSTLINSIDKQVMAIALGTVSARSTELQKNNISRVSEKILDLTERKKICINLRLITDKLILSLPPLEAKTVILSEFDGMPIAEMSKILYISQRTVSRCKSEAISKMTESLASNAVFCSVLQNAFQSEPCVYKLFLKFKKSNANHPFHSSHDAVALSFA